MSKRNRVDTSHIVGTYRTDYPKKRIGGGNPYYKCAKCGLSDPDINGRIEGHRDSCSWAKQQIAKGNNKPTL